LGQTVNSYRPEFPPRAHYDFSDLLQDVCSIPDVGRIRFISPHPYYLSQKLIQTMADNKKICEHIHLPVQSGSNKILKRMKRNYTRESYLSGLRALREAIPSVAITTDIIVGFPGETKEDYLETLSLIQEADFDSAYCFKYSPRPGTESAQWEDDVPQETKEERINHLLDLTEAQGRLKARNLIGTTQEVLIEEDKGNNLFRGKTRGAWRIRIENPTLQPGQTVWAKVTNTHSRELHGELLEAPRPMPSLATL
jgi:tRNA-2-methylthio-N6-dimethylallyladenosine synthase